MSATLQFLKAAIKAPLQISTLFQTATATVNRLLSPLRQDNHCSVLELGVGAGAVTKKAYKVMKNKEKYLGFEINTDLYNYVREEYKEFQFVCASAEVISDYTKNRKYDLIVSTLPWSLFDDFMRATILNEISKHLEKGGYFKTYMVCNALMTRSGRLFRRQLEERFEVSSKWVFFNMPPAKVFECRTRVVSVKNSAGV
ncbi:MAG: methyltransferase domain-containing protein [Bdellovibrionaceae bacterium]|nr:methyltransferase domain-containing protein [Pseudobdellovibrionaceae bacterium]